MKFSRKLFNESAGDFIVNWISLAHIQHREREDKVSFSNMMSIFSSEESSVNNEIYMLVGLSSRTVHYDVDGSRVLSFISLSKQHKAMIRSLRKHHL
jgi:hypothetical protein